MSAWHLLRPYWLLLLPIVWWLVWYLYHAQSRRALWRQVIAPELLPHVLQGDVYDQKLPYIGLVLAWTLALLALAGPSFHQVEQPSFREQNYRVLVLALSPSMNATDLAPSRLKRAQFKLLDILAKRPGDSMGLVVFAKAPYTVSPITEDGATLKQFIQSLSTDLMPEAGHDLAWGLKMAHTLLKRAQASKGRILLLTDGTANAAARAQVQHLVKQGVQLDIIGVGSEAGAPIPTDRGFLKDDNQQVVMAKLDGPALTQLAKTGGGRYAKMSFDDTDIQYILAHHDHKQVSDEAQGAAFWQDDGVWLLIPLAFLVMFAFRRGWFEVI